jgi:homoserine dehydrogenase
MSLLDLDRPVRSRLKPRSAPRPLPAAIDVVVLKFGSSILKGPADIPAVVSEIYRHVRQGRRVVAVVSAFHGHTDRLLGEARGLGHDHDNDHLPRYVALGEETAASLVAIGCDRVGLSCQALSVRELGIVAHGSAEEASPVRLDGNGVARALGSHEAVIVPGYGASDEAGRTVLLGRGGSDLTAIFLAAELGLASVRLLKDVDGVYEGDPNTGKAASRFEALDWATARTVAGKLVQDRAIDFAEARGLAIEVAAMGRDCKSVIGHAGRPAVSARPPVRRKVVVAGCGVVGGGVLSRLLAEPDRWEVLGVLVRNPVKLRDRDLPRNLVTTDADDLLARGADLLVETLSDGQAGRALVMAALKRGLDVVSADKQALAGDLPGLQLLARSKGRRLAYSAAVGGGAPVVETVRAARAEGEVLAVEGVLNGTVNFLIDRLGRGVPFPAALEEARRAGFAEEDPSADLDGRDAAAKLRILAFEAFGQAPQETQVARQTFHLGLASSPQGWRSLRQVSRCRRTAHGLAAEVVYEPVDTASPFAGLKGERNALKVLMADGSVRACQGRGAGRWPTAESVLADLGDLHRAAIIRI